MDLSVDLTVNLKGSHVLVTGGSAGIGRAIALAFARNGATVAVHYFRTQEGGEQTVQQIHDLGGSAFLVRADVAVKADVDGMMAEGGLLHDYCRDAAQLSPTSGRRILGLRGSLDKPRGLI